jgi:hypothetical protein
MLLIFEKIIWIVMKCLWHFSARCGDARLQIPAFGRPMQGDHKLEASLGYTSRLCLKRANKRTSFLSFRNLKTHFYTPLAFTEYCYDKVSKTSLSFVHYRWLVFNHLTAHKILILQDQQKYSQLHVQLTPTASHSTQLSRFQTHN